LKTTDEGKLVKSHRDLNVYKNAMNSAMDIFHITSQFPREEKFSMVDQMRRSSRSVCANIAEAWRKRRYKPHFISKLTDSEAEAAETMVWIEFAERSDYIDSQKAIELEGQYDHILGQLVLLEKNADKWIIR